MILSFRYGEEVGLPLLIVTLSVENGEIHRRRRISYMSIKRKTVSAVDHGNGNGST
jgi:hypothetical protein